MIIGGVMTVICRIAFSKFSLLLFLQIPKVQWLWFFVIVGLSNFVGYPLYTKLLGTYTPTFMSLSGFLCPVITATLGYLVLGEQILFKSLLLSLIFGSLGLLVYSSGHFTVFKKKASRQ
jgi:drug/metabolite transporter (DMT)-like permease